MKSKKRLYAASTIALATSAAYVVEVPVFAQTTTYKDVKTTDAHYVAITQLAKEGIVTGVNSTAFKPYQDATRAEAAVFIANALKLDTKNVKNPGFKDVPKTASYYGAVAALCELGIIAGFRDGTFQPNSTLKRSQIAKMLTLSFDLPLSKVKQTSFKDVNSISDEATKRFITTLVDLDITKGTTSTTFSPYSTLKRGQLATFIYRTKQTVSDEFTIISIE